MKVYLVSGSKTGGKFWEITTKGREFTTRFGKIGDNGRKMTKKWSNASECEKEANKVIKQKKKKGYKVEQTNKRKRKTVDESSDEEEESSEDDDNRKRKSKRKKVRPPPKKKRRKTKQPSSSEEEESDSYDSEDEENEKDIKKLLKEGEITLNDENDSKQITVDVDGKSYSMTRSTIGSKRKGRAQKKKFTSKKKAFDAAVSLLVEKMRDGFYIPSESEEEEESSSSEEEEEEESGIFDDYLFCISGAFSMTQTEIRSLIKEHGGIIKTQPTKDTDFVMVKTSNPHLDSTKVQKAKKLNIPIVTEDFLHDCIEKKKLLKYKEYIIEEEEEEDEDEDDDEDDDVKPTKTTKKSAKVSDDDDSDSDSDNDKKKKSKSFKKVKMKGSAPVDEYFEYADSCHVYEANGVVYDAMLNQTNIGNNNNKFYKLQVLETDSGGSFYCYFRWGRVGYKGQYSQKNESLAKCISLFEKKFHDKTLNDWEDRNDFEPHARKYTYLKMDYSSKGGGGGNGDDSDDPWAINEDDDESKIESKLDENIQDLVELIFDKKMMEDQLKEIGYDAAKLPLGKIDQTVIREAFEVLKDIEDELNAKSNAKNSNNSKRKSTTKINSGAITDLSSRYYTLIPHEFGFSVPPPINTDKALKKEMKLLEALSEIEVAAKLLRGDKKDNIEKHPIDKHFDLLKTEMQNIEKNDSDFKMIRDYVKLTHAATHNRYTLSVENVFRINRDGSSDRFKKWEKDENRMLLWHGSRLTNFVGIISQGLRIAPPEAPVTGYMFGKGVYFADMCSKSANYCFTSPDKNTGLILLCEVALGAMNELLQSDYYANELPSGKSSTKGCGKTTPDPSTYKKLPNGCVVPMGKGVVDNSHRSSLLYNEYIVYDTSQIRMRYLIKLKFNYKNRGGW